MRFEIADENGRRTVAAIDYPADYEPTLRGLHFEPDTASGALVWEYPAGVGGWEDASRNWLHHGPEFFDQLHGTRPVDWEAGLAWIIDRVERAEADWFLVGSAALAARGVDVDPGNVDIALDEAGADRLASRVGEALMQPIHDTEGWVVSTRYGRLFHDCPIQVIGGLLDQDWPTPWDSTARAALETITWRGHAIRVAPLSFHLAHARRMLRNDHARAIFRYNAEHGDLA
jgi:hypothetical protein